METGSGVVPQVIGEGLQGSDRVAALQQCGQPANPPLGWQQGADDFASMAARSHWLRPPKNEGFLPQPTPPLSTPPSLNPHPSSPSPPRCRGVGYRSLDFCWVAITGSFFVTRDVAILRRPGAVGFYPGPRGFCRVDLVEGKESGAKGFGLSYGSYTGRNIVQGRH